MSRVDDDREKLLDAVGAFRTRANLHNSSSDMALVRWAHEGGKSRPWADMVRTCWHDYAMARTYEELRVVEFVIDYSGDKDSRDGDPAPSVGEDVGDRPGSDTGSSSVSRGEEIEHPALASPRKRATKPKPPPPESADDVLF